MEKVQKVDKLYSNILKRAVALSLSSYYLVCYNVNDDDVSVKCSFYRKSKNFICLATIIASFT